MKNLSKVIGILCLIIGLLGLFFIDNNIRRNSSSMGDAVLMAKENIPEGFIIRYYGNDEAGLAKTKEEIDKYFTIKKIPKSEQIQNALTVETTTKLSLNSFFKKSEISHLSINDDFLKNIVNKKITMPLLPNQQISINWLSNDLTEFTDDERIFNLSVDLTSSVGGEINVGDYVDVWTSKNGIAQKVLGPIRILKIKSADNLEPTNEQKVIPSTIIVKCDEEQIKELKKLESNSLFLTKYGIKPTNSIK